MNLHIFNSLPYDIDCKRFIKRNGRGGFLIIFGIIRPNSNIELAVRTMAPRVFRNIWSNTENLQHSIEKAW